MNPTTTTLAPADDVFDNWDAMTATGGQWWLLGIVVLLVLCVLVAGWQGRRDRRSTVRMAEGRILRFHGEDRRW